MPAHVQETPTFIIHDRAHVISPPRLSPFSVCNIEKSGVPGDEASSTVLLFFWGGGQPTVLGMHTSTYAVRTDCMFYLMYVMCNTHKGIQVYTYCVTLVRVSCTCNYTTQNMKSREA